MKGEIITTIKAVERTAWGLAACGLAVGLVVGLALPWRVCVALAALVALWGSWRVDFAGTYRPAHLRAAEVPPVVPMAPEPAPGVQSWPCPYCEGRNDPALPSCGHCGAARRS